MCLLHQQESLSFHPTPGQFYGRHLHYGTLHRSLWLAYEVTMCLKTKYWWCTSHSIPAPRKFPQINLCCNNRGMSNGCNKISMQYLRSSLLITLHCDLNCFVFRLHGIRSLILWHVYSLNFHNQVRVGYNY